jgi:hypothetical protein
MAKGNKFENCSCCARRKECWNTEAYGDTYKADERHKKPFPRDVACIKFKFDSEMGGFR